LPDGKPYGGRYKREFDVQEAKAQENFTTRTAAS
jgi:hypothetical protein